MSDEKKKNEITVPEVENDVKVIEMRLGELVLGVVACLTLAGLGYTYYTFIKSKAESRKIESFASVVSEAIRSVSEVMDKNVNKTPIKNAIKTARRSSSRQSKGAAQA